MSDQETPIFRPIAGAATRDAFSSGTGATYAYRSLTGLTWAVYVAAGIRLVFGVALEGLNVLPALNLGLDPNTAQAVLGWLHLLGLWSGLIIGGFWIYRAAANVRARGAKGLPDSPGWSVGWFAVPIANFFRPAVAIRNIWRASIAPDTWRAREPPWFFAVWWAGWIVTGLSRWITNLAAQFGDSFTPITILAKVSEWVAIIGYILVVRSIAQAQMTTPADVAEEFR